jgi:hypothetical protein
VQLVPHERADLVELTGQVHQLQLSAHVTNLSHLQASDWMHELFRVAKLEKSQEFKSLRLFDFGHKNFHSSLCMVDSLQELIAMKPALLRWQLGRFVWCKQFWKLHPKQRVA